MLTAELWPVNISFSVKVLVSNIFRLKSFEAVTCKMHTIIHVTSLTDEAKIQDSMQNEI